MRALQTPGKPHPWIAQFKIFFPYFFHVEQYPTLHSCVCVVF
jgi:hypothetical protein